MRLRDHYDWLVLGDSHGALLSAGLAAKLGFSVLILPFKNAARQRVSGRGQIFDPESNFQLGLGVGDGSASGLYRCVLERLGLSPAEAERVRARQAFPQVATPNHRVVFATEREEFRLELARELGAGRARQLGLTDALDFCAGPVQEFWRTVPEKLTIRERTAKPTCATLEELFGKLRRQANAAGVAEPAGKWILSKGPLERGFDAPEDRDVWELLEGAWYAWAGSTRPGMRGEDLLAILGAARGAAAYQGGMTALRDLLLRLAQRAGAHAPERADCRRLFIENGRLVGVQLANRGNVIGATGAIMGCTISQIRAHLSSSGREWPNRLRNAPQPQAWRFTLALTARSEAVPPGMASRLVWKEGGAPPLEIEIADTSDYGISGGSHRYLFARTPLPFADSSLQPDQQRLLASRIFRQLTEVFPFLEYHVTRIFPDFRDTGYAEFREAHPFESLAEIPENLRIFSGAGMGSRSGVEGLFVASSESYPQFGSSGQVLSALEATAWIAHRLGVPGPFA